MLLTSDTGRVRFGPRLGAYLANELACHYKAECVIANPDPTLLLNRPTHGHVNERYYTKHDKAVPTRRADLYHDLTDAVNAMEDMLSSKLGTLDRRLARQRRPNRK